MRRHRLRVEHPELNLVPLLDMVSMLIQMLLVNAQFGVYAELDAAVAAGTKEALGEELGLSVAIDTTGYAVRWLDGGNAVERRVDCAGTCTPETYDTTGLRSVLLELKDRRPDEAQAVLVPGEGVPFEVVVVTMDAVRADGADAPLFPELVVSP
ncbi:MAG: biopolymer transporter ExbD [Alphaproteobacteria bacterium]|nr:biopolymer transporter ExbD [Myxococcales bacterium]MCB9689072.1 biopolymer transporter ExbD [Alphaproteobacteria bacterium]MCB9699740.1 biopolymer transporter ExbD [Alphaproteobacteria bacterium]